MFWKRRKPANLNTKKTSLGQYFKNGSRVVLKTSELFWKIYCSKVLENFEKFRIKNVLKTPMVSHFWWVVKHSLIFTTFYTSIIFPYPVDLLRVLHIYNPQLGQQQLPISSPKPTYEMIDVFYCNSLWIWKGEYITVLLASTKGWWADDEVDEKEQRDHPLSTYAKFFEKLTFLTPWYAHVVSFSENFAHVLNGWSQPWKRTLKSNSWDLKDKYSHVSNQPFL